jgi:hypothetical protein
LPCNLRTSVPLFASAKVLDDFVFIKLPFAGATLYVVVVKYLSVEIIAQGEISITLDSGDFKNGPGVELADQTV